MALRPTLQVRRFYCPCNDPVNFASIFACPGPIRGTSLACTASETTSSSLRISASRSRPGGPAESDCPAFTLGVSLDSAQKLA